MNHSKDRNFHFANIDHYQYIRSVGLVVTRISKRSLLLQERKRNHWILSTKYCLFIVYISYKTPGQQIRLTSDIVTGLTPQEFRIQELQLLQLVQFERGSLNYKGEQ